MTAKACFFSGLPINVMGNTDYLSRAMVVEPVSFRNQDDAIVRRIRERPFWRFLLKRIVQCVVDDVRWQLSGTLIENHQYSGSLSNVEDSSGISRLLIRIGNDLINPPRQI